MLGEGKRRGAGRPPAKFSSGLLGANLGLAVIAWACARVSPTGRSGETPSPERPQRGAANRRVPRRRPARRATPNQDRGFREL